MKSGSLNLLEPSGPVQACNGIALTLPLHFTSYSFNIATHCPHQMSLFCHILHVTSISTARPHGLFTDMHCKMRSVCVYEQQFFSIIKTTFVPGELWDLILHAAVSNKALFVCLFACLFCGVRLEAFNSSY